MRFHEVHETEPGFVGVRGSLDPRPRTASQRVRKERSLEYVDGLAGGMADERVESGHEPVGPGVDLRGRLVTDFEIPLDVILESSVETGCLADPGVVREPCSPVAVVPELLRERRDLRRELEVTVGEGVGDAVFGWKEAGKKRRVRRERPRGRGVRVRVPRCVRPERVQIGRRFPVVPVTGHSVRPQRVQNEKENIRWIGHCQQVELTVQYMLSLRAHHRYRTRSCKQFNRLPEVYRL